MRSSLVDEIQPCGWDLAMWMRSSQVVIELLAVLTVLGSIQASSDTGESEGRQMSSVEERTIKPKPKNQKMPPWNKKSVRFRFASNFSLHFAISRSFSLQIFLGYAIFRFIFVSLRFFRFILLIFPFVFASDFCFFASMWNKRNQVFFALKRNENFASISIFASEAKTRAHPTPDTL